MDLEEQQATKGVEMSIPEALELLNKLAQSSTELVKEAEQRAAYGEVGITPYDMLLVVTQLGNIAQSISLLAIITASLGLVATDQQDTLTEIFSKVASW